MQDGTHRIPGRRRRQRKGRGAARMLAQILTPWSLAAALVVSFTASAGESTRRLDQEFRRSAMIEPQRLTLMPPRLAALPLHGEATAAIPAPISLNRASRLLPHIRRVDLARAIRPPEQV
ncbi:MAG: hypothetical protein LDL25_09225, partial [Hyphomicrobiales bacterium]|nr:hypothetical protein [Hyphomicrobiales bacterium]